MIELIAAIYLSMQLAAFFAAGFLSIEDKISTRQAMAVFAFWPILLPVAGLAGLWQFWEGWQDQRALRAKEREIRLEREYRRIAAEIRESE